MALPRAEHPRPQFERASWLNLNGEWDFAFDFSQSGLEREYFLNGDFPEKITVPFCPESELSGIGFKDFIPAAWYRREFALTPEQASGVTLLRFGAVDYECRAYVNGVEAGRHIGGYGSFAFDISALVHEGANTVVAYAKDDTRSGRQPTGKQANQFQSNGCMYTRTTGIWQTVWLEFAPKAYIKKINIIPDAENGAITVTAWLPDGTKGMLTAKASFEGQPEGEAQVAVNGSLAIFTLKVNEKRLWAPGQPALYDLELSLSADTGTDNVKSYFGLRTVNIKDNAICLNGKPVFQRLVLDQGFYPDGIYTAPDDDAFIRDIKLSMSLGFNGARLHEKAFEERFLYHADRLGYLVWGEYANWGYDHSSSIAVGDYLPEWLSLVSRDFNHPSVVGWCPFNETWDVNGKKQDDELLRVIYLATKAADPTRPVIDTSGNFHVETDIYDVHDYEQNVEIFKERYGSLKKGEAFDTHSDRQTYGGQPFFVSEYGGACWNPADQGWGYGDAPKTEDEMASRYEGMTGALLGAEGVCAFCYTQLYDVEQEQNGLFTYARGEKFSPEVYDRIRATNKQEAAIEKAGQ
ncbi:MAG: beta-galactosidase [Clostridiales bacterium]|nr:beta-galactosidase [Clostridiales bacterium]